MANLSDSTIFLHGPSGSGKSVIENKITEKYLNMGYKVHYISSGALFRDAQNIQAAQEVSATMNAGKYFDTLDDIMPGLKTGYTQFLGDYDETDGKAILILDGFVRRDRFVRRDKETDAIIENVPSQIEQVAAAILECRNATSNVAFPGIDEAVEEIVNAKHILIDINPRDAEAQMKIRANKEIIAIGVALAARVETRNLPITSTAVMALLLDQLSNIANYNTEDKLELAILSGIAENIKEEIANELKVLANGSYAKFFGQFGIMAGLRDDDISPIARRKRIENYVTYVEGDGGTVYTPGFASEAITNNLGFVFHENGSFTSTMDNCIVIKNGKSRGIELTDFQGACEGVSNLLLDSTRRSREGTMHGIESPRIHKEE